MKKLTVLFLLTLALSFSVSAQTTEDKEAVRRAAIDYVESFYEMSPEKAERSIHPDLAKRGFSLRQGQSAYTPLTMTFTRLLENVKTYNQNGRVPKDAPKEVVVFEVLDQTASAKVTAFWGIDYLHLAKYDGKWKIINVLWQSPPKQTK